MSDIKCPYCNKPLQGKAIHISEVYMINLYHCANQDCESTEFLVGCKEFWDILGQLIRTRKALDVAVDALREIDKTRSVANHKIGTQDKTLNSGIVFCWTTPDEIHNALAEITALEQKDK